MKIAVTGHTSGLGKAFFDCYVSQGHEVEGFSHKNNFDLRNWSRLQKMLDITENFDLIISNAKPDFAQTILLYELARRDRHAKKIISIGSVIVDLPVDKKQDIGINLYKTQKLSLQDAHRQLTDKISDFDSILIHPYHLYDKKNTVDHNSLHQWIGRMESAIIDQFPKKEIFVK